MSKHTPGPWLVAFEDKSFVYAVGPHGTNSFWAHVQAAGPDRIGAEEKAANAALIAAAPRMYELLRAVLDTARDDPNPTALDRALDDIDTLLDSLGGKS